MIHNIGHRIPFQLRQELKKVDIEEEKPIDEPVTPDGPQGPVEPKEPKEPNGPTGPRHPHRPPSGFKIDFDLLEVIDVDETEEPETPDVPEDPVTPDEPTEPETDSEPQDTTQAQDDKSSYSITYNDDGTLNHVTLTDKEGNVIVDTDVNESIVEDKHNQLQELQKQADEILQKLQDEEPLTAPYPENFMKIDDNGNKVIDHAAYLKAMQEFQKVKDERDSQMNELQQKFEDIGKEIQDLSGELEVINMLQTIGKTENKLKELKANGEGDNSAVDKMLEELEKQKEDFANATIAKENAQAEIKELEAKLRELKQPIPPATFEFLNDKGELDTEAFKKAENEYREALDDYKKQEAELLHSIKQAENDFKKAEIDIRSSETSIGYVEGSANWLTDLKTQINETDDPDAKAELQAAFDKISDNIEKRLDLNNKMADLQNQSMEMDIPQAPEVQDFLTTVYTGTTSDGNEFSLKFDEDGNAICTMSVYNPETGGYEYQEVKVDASKVSKDDYSNVGKIDLGDGIKVYFKGQKELDKQAYADALKEYNDKKADYNKAQNDLQVKLSSLQNEDMDLSMEAELLHADLKFKSELNKVTDPDIRDAMQNQYDELVATMKQQYSLKQKQFDLEREMLSKESPVAPSANDYTRTVHTGIDNSGNKHQVSINDDGSITVTSLKRQANGEYAYISERVDASDVKYDSQGNIVSYKTPNDETVFVETRQELDTDAYMNANIEFKKAQSEYEKEMAELNQQMKTLDNLAKEIGMKHNRLASSIDFLAGAGETLSNIKDLIDNASDPDVKAGLQKEYDKIEQDIHKRLSIAKQMDDIQESMLKEPVPTAPSAYDYLVTVYSGIDADGNDVRVKPGQDGLFEVTIYTADGYKTVEGKSNYGENGNTISITLPDGSEIYVTKREELDTDAYKAALEDFEKAKAEYDKKMQEGNEMIAKLQQLDRNIDIEIKTAKESCSVLRDCNNLLNEIDEQIKNAPNDFVRAELMSKRDEVKDIMTKTLALEETIKETVQSFMREPIPTPPSPNDYAKSVYSGTDANGNKFNVERGTDGTFTITMLNEDGAYKTIVLNGEDDGQNSVRFRLPDGRVLYATRHEELDNDAYKKAMEDYEKQMDEYKGKEGNYQKEIETLQKQKEFFYHLLHAKI